jgi:tetratricopeptide (TPR) repeat protein
MNHKRVRAGLGAIGLIFVSTGASHVINLWRFRANLEQARREIATGDMAAARDRLSWLSSRWAVDPEVEYQLGVCRLSQGDLQGAKAAWERVQPGSQWAGPATVARAQALIEHEGRFVEAERLLVPLSQGIDLPSAHARQALIRLYYSQGRKAEIRRLLESEWNLGKRRAALLRELWRLDSDPLSVGMIRTELDQAADKDPDDERVWLGRANLATRSGFLEDAARWLDLCLRKNPADPPVWGARLSWALTADRVEEAHRALAHLSADFLDQDLAFDLRAWFAQRLGPPDTLKRVLEERIEANPGASEALAALADLEFTAGRARSARQLRLRKARIDEIRERYRERVAEESPVPDFSELGRLAESLGRWFEARGWYTLAVERRPDDQSDRESRDRLERRLASSAYAQRDDRILHDLLTALERIMPRGPLSTSASAVLSPLPRFVDDAQAVGLRFAYQNGHSPTHHLPETMGGGVGLLDYDGDGWLDVYVVQGGTFPPEPNQARSVPGDRLFHNRGGGVFEDVTLALGIDRLPRGYGHGVAVGDYDNDGDPDLFVTRWRSYALLRNDGVRFVDATDEVGLGGDRDWPTSAAFADLDRDGDLDLFVCHYLAWDPDHPLSCRTALHGDGLAYCDPRRCAALADRLFRNDGGRFVEVTFAAGIHDRHGRGLGVIAADLDQDGWIDLYVANDTTANDFWRNLGGMRFEEVGLTAGVACNASGSFQAGMGVACGDLDGDGLPDLAVTNFYGESTTAYHNLGHGVFSDRTSSLGLAAPSRFLLGFGIAFLDFDNDGHLDLLTANGHVNDFRPRVPYAMPPQLYSGRSGRLEDVSRDGGPIFKTPRVGRGLATGDLDNDGRVDAIMVCHDGPVVYLHNRTEGGHFVAFQLVGTLANRDAVGAQVSVFLPGRRQVASVTGGGSYQSASSSRLHFGLGSRERIDLVEVVWPSGRKSRYHKLAADRGYLLTEGRTEVKPLPGFRGRGLQGR